MPLSGFVFLAASFSDSCKCRRSSCGSGGRLWQRLCSRFVSLFVSVLPWRVALLLESDWAKASCATCSFHAMARPLHLSKLFDSALKLESRVLNQLASGIMPCNGPTRNSFKAQPGPNA